MLAFGKSEFFLNAEISIEDAWTGNDIRAGIAAGVDCDRLPRYGTRNDCTLSRDKASVVKPPVCAPLAAGQIAIADAVWPNP